MYALHTVDPCMNQMSGKSSQKATCGDQVGASVRAADWLSAYVGSIALLQ